PGATGPTRGGAFGAVCEGWLDAPGSKERHEEAEHKCSIWVSILDFVFCYVFGGFLDPAQLASRDFQSRGRSQGCSAACPGQGSQDRGTQHSAHGAAAPARRGSRGGGS